MRWEKDIGQYTSGEILYLGKWKVGGFYFDSTRSQGHLKKWRATCTLPGIKNSLGHFATEAEAKDKAEFAVKHWLDGLPSNDGGG